MNATLFDITERNARPALGLASIDDFKLRPRGGCDLGTLLSAPNHALYALDLAQGRAVFVETPLALDLSQAPFFYAAQFEHATRVWTISFEALVNAAQSIRFDPNRLVCIHSVGRAGSTLASQVFAQVPGVVNISEPDAVSVLAAARKSRAPDPLLHALLGAVVRVLCKTPASTAWVIKGRSFVIELADALHRCFPQMKHLFLYRDAASWLTSSIRAFRGDASLTDAERAAQEQQARDYMAPVTPLVATYDGARPLNYAGVLALMWLSVMERYLQLHANGMHMLAIPYHHWVDAPLATATAMLEYCNCTAFDEDRVQAALLRDSQAGTALAQQSLATDKTLRSHDLAELAYHLERHPYIRSADFIVPNSLQHAA